MLFRSIEREICRAILLEMIYRNKNSLASETIYVEPPQWLIEGLLAAAPTSERAELIEALIVATNVPPLDDFLRQGAELFDSAGRLLHRAHSLALVQLLIGLPGGRDSLYRYIENLATASNDPSRDLRATFAQLAGGNAESLWKSQISQLSVSGNHQLLSFARTEAKLAELLRGQLKDFSQRKLSRSEQLSLQRLNQELLLLAVRANPVCRALIQQYQQIALELAAGKNRGTSARLAGLNNSRARISARIREIDDYMNWFEAAKLETSSRLFDGYLKAAEESAASTSRRKDALSVYLDAMEQEF